MNTPNKVITHTAVSGKHHTAYDVGQWHLDRWGGYSPSTFLPENDIRRYVGYHIVIDWDGTVHQCRNFTDEGIHCKGQNFSSIGVCFMGNGDLHEPSIEQREAWIKEVWPLIKKTYPNITVNDIYPHRKYANKTCHGKLLSDTFYADLLRTTEDKHMALKRQYISLLQQLNRLYVLLARSRMK